MYGLKNICKRSRYENTHKLTGCLEAIAEIQEFYPELFDLPDHG